jgi:hypothetical protein
MIRLCSVLGWHDVNSLIFTAFPRHGGGGGIRTPETLSSLTVFKTAGFNRSPTPPCLILAHLLDSRGARGCSIVAHFFSRRSIAATASALTVLT